MNIHKTNAARILDQLHIPYELIPYEVDEAYLSAVHVASTLGEPVERVFKTILLRGDKKGLLVTVVPGDCEVNLKAVAPISGNKKVEPVMVKELLPLTGYIRWTVWRLRNASPSSVRRRCLPCRCVCRSMSVARHRRAGSRLPQRRHWRMR